MQVHLNRVGDRAKGLSPVLRPPDSECMSTMYLIGAFLRDLDDYPTSANKALAKQALNAQRTVQCYTPASDLAKSVDRYEKHHVCMLTS